MANMLEASPPPDPSPDPYEDCGQGGPCQELRSTEDTPTSYLNRILPRTGNFLLRRVASSGPVRAPVPSRRAVNMSGFLTMTGTAASIHTADPCRDLAESIYHATVAYRSSELTLKGAVSDLFRSVSFAIVGGRLVGSLSPAAWMAANFVADRLENYSHKIQLDLLAGLYSLNGCWTTNWGGGGSGQSGGGGLQWECHSETWEISYDGGATWEPIQVDVCQYVSVE